MSNLIVTSMSREGHEAYGRQCIASIAQYWPAPLVVYGDERFDVSPAEFRLTSDITRWKKQIWLWKKRRVRRPQYGWIKPQSYIWDAERFAVKVFVWADAAERLGAGVLVWLDADTETFAPVPDGFVEQLLGGRSVAYLGRHSMHPETGFVAFRIPEALPLLQWMRRAYQTRRYIGWDDGWTDCHALRTGLRVHRVSRRDLTSRLRTRWHSRIDAMALSALGPYVTHYKGRRLAGAA